MNPVSPAIVAQKAVAQLPRWALVLLCLIYVVPGFVGRQPWKNADMEAFGFMLALARPDGGTVSWLRPMLAGQMEPSLSLLHTWLGAWFIRLAPVGWESAAARLPFMGMLILTLVSTWYGVYALARTRAAQPVAFAFGGEARPTDYARTLADGGLLALLGCLGLAQLSHEITPALSQLCFTSLLFFGLTPSSHRRRWRHLCAAALGLLGLTLSGAPAMAALLGLGGLLVLALAPADPDRHAPSMLELGLLSLFLLLSITLSGALDLWRWRLMTQPMLDLHAFGRLLLWFTWPAGPLALWSLWRWRRQLLQAWRIPHIGLPLWFVLVTVGTTWLTGVSDRALLSALPAIATLAAFALPTLRRSVGAFIDWFTLLFFSIGALVIWVVWIAMQTGTPAVTARNVARAAPEFVYSLSVWPVLIAGLGMLSWLALVRWRTARHRIELWKSLVLPAAGTTLCWLLLMTLWLPLLDHGRSYAPLITKIQQTIPPNHCVQSLGLTNAQNAALLYHGQWQIRPAGPASTNCSWLITSTRELPRNHERLQQWGWEEMVRHRRASDNKETLVIFQRVPR